MVDPPVLWSDQGRYSYQTGGQIYRTPYQLTKQEFAVLGRLPGVATSSGIPLDTPAWTMGALDDVWSSPALRGGDRVIPYATGVLHEPRVVSSQQFTVRLTINGQYRYDGAIYGDPRGGLIYNMLVIRTLSDHAVAYSNGRREFALYHRGDNPSDPGPVFYGEVQIERVRIERTGDSLAVAQITCTAPEPLQVKTYSAPAGWDQYPDVEPI